MQTNLKKTGHSRRDFLGISVAAATFTIMPRHVLGGRGYIAPSDKLNIACIGIGGKGRVDVQEVGSENIVALCDVDEKRAVERSSQYPLNAYEQFPRATKYHDFRRMLEKENGIDAVTISTPDHTHAVIAMAAIQAGKHVFCQKPLTRTIFEARKLTEAARAAGVATQMGIQAHAGEGPRLINEWISSGAIGKVSEVHCWTNRPIWPQGITRPKETPEPPSMLNWDLWLGPAPVRPYHPVYVPFGWRAWWDFGCGALGDMGCHIFDYPVWALNLRYPSSVEAHSTAVNSETAPVASLVYYDFPASDKRPPVRLTWYDGGMMPPLPDGLDEDLYGDSHSGVLFVGDEGKLLHRHHAPKPILIPRSRYRDWTAPKRTLARSPGHYQEWIAACKGGAPALCNFDYSGPLTEIVLLGNLAIRTGKKIEWDGPKMTSPNVPEAAQYVREACRPGWSLES